MFIDLQISSAVLKQALRNRLRKDVLAISVTDPVKINGIDYLLDHIEISEAEGATTLDRSTVVKIPITIDGTATAVDGVHLRFTQVANIYFVELTHLQNTPNTDPTIDQQYSLRFAFEIYAQVQDGAPYIHITLKEWGVDVGGEILPLEKLGIDQKTKQTMEAAIGKHEYSDRCDLSSVEEQLPDAKLANVGITLNHGRDSVTLRLQLQGEPDPVDSWSRFYRADMDNRISESGWNVLVDRELLMASAIARMAAGCADPKAKDLVPKSIVAEWNGANATCTVTCDGTVSIDWVPDPSVEIKSTIHWSVESGKLITTLQITHTVDASADVAFAAILGALVGSLLGGPWGAIEGAIAGAAIVTGAEANIDVPEVKPGRDWTPIGIDIWQRSDPIRISNPIIGRFYLWELKPSDEGLLIGGAVATDNVIAPVLKWEVSPFSWAVRGSCYDGHIVNNAGGIVFSCAEGGGLYVCKVSYPWQPPNTGGMHPKHSIYEKHLSTDPLELETAYSGFVPSGGSIIAEFDSDSDIGDTFFNNPYPFEILLQTNAGVRWFKLDPPTRYPSQDRVTFALELGQAKAKCMTLMQQFWDELQIHISWFSDPPPSYSGRMWHLWQVQVEGLRSGDSIRFRGYDGHQVTDVHGTANGKVALSALLPASNTSREVTLGLQRNHGQASSVSEPSRIAPQQIKVIQLLVVQTATLQLQSPCLHISAGSYQGCPSLVATTETGIFIFDTGRPDRVRPLRSFHGLQAAGAVAFADELLAWSPGGRLRLLNAQGERTAELGTIRDVVVIENHVYVASDNCVNILDGDLKPLARFAIKGVIRFVKDSIFMTHQTLPRVTGVQSLAADVSTTAAGGIAGAPWVAIPKMLVPQNGGWDLQDMVTADSHLVAQTFKQHPWFVSAAVFGHRVALLDEDTRTIRLASVAKSVRL